MNNLTIPSNETFPQQYMINTNHNSYFQHLETKLISQSQALTQFMGKSVIGQKYHREMDQWMDHTLKQRREKSENKINNVGLKYNYSYKMLNNKIQSFDKNRIKEMCDKLKQSTFMKQQKKKCKDNIRCFQKKFKKQSNKIDLHGLISKQTQLTNISINPNNEFISKATLPYSNMQPFSLKDTISTESWTSIKVLDQHFKESTHHIFKLNDFKILRHISQNKYGSVYLVKHKPTNFICSLKRITNFLSCKDEQLINQRIREMKIQSFLDHPNIVQLYSIFMDGNDLYLLMQTCFNGDLYSNLKTEGRFEQDKIRSIVKQICYAIQYIHDNDILHRDIKPQNILFHENVAKICDFGCSVFSPLLRDTYCGTPLYSSPEIVQKQQYDSILTYELLYGKPPYEIRSSRDLEQIISAGIKFSKTKPATLEIKDFILRCLQKNPKERFSVIKLLEHQFLATQK